MKTPLFILMLLCTTLCIAKQDTEEYTIIQDRYPLPPILAPSFADQKSLKMRLNNGLEVYLVSDPKLDKSSAAMVVKTGSWEDPKNAPGTAHFLEHMLFLGTKKYPKEGEYKDIIDARNGNFNAYTGPDYTVYLFSINHNDFPEILDRFADFFIEPLFNPSGVGREVKAIDSEYAKNIENDGYRMYYVLKELSNPTHPNHLFSSGNKSSLEQVSQDSLKKWYKEHYSANRMELIISSPLPLEELQQLVVTNFKDIPNHNLPDFDYVEPMLSNDVKGSMIYIEPVKNLRELNLIWELPPRFVDMRDTQPGSLIAYVLGDEGKNSLFADLKKEKWADGLSAGSSIWGGHNSMFSIGITLTDAGVKNINSVILKCFEALANIKEKGMPKYIYEESQQIAKMHYQQKTREDAFQSISNAAQGLRREELESYPAQTLFIQRFDPKAIQEYLALLTPNNCIFTLIAPKNLTSIAPDHIEKWLGVSYSIHPFSKETLLKWSHATPQTNIALPPPNPFIPKNMDVLRKPTKQISDTNPQIPHPLTIIDNDMAKVYFAPDDLYGLPEVSWAFEIKTPSVYPNSPESAVLADLYVKYVEEALSSYTYPALIGGLQFSIAASGNGFTLSIIGYSDKADELFLKIIQTLKDLPLNEQHFKRYKDSLLRQYQDASVDMPIYQSMEYLKDVLHESFVSNKQKAAAIKKITFSKLKEFETTLFDQTYVEGMLYGNITKEQALQGTQQLLSTLNSKYYPIEKRYKPDIIVLPQKQGPFFYEAKTKSQGTAIILAIQAEPFSLKMGVVQNILMQTMSAPFYSSLRTKQQTGYIVQSDMMVMDKHILDIFLAQSNTHDGRDLLARFEQFIEGFMQEITHGGITPEYFASIKNSLLTPLRQTPKSMADMSHTLQALAFTHDGEFDRTTKRIKAFEELSYEEFIEIARQTMGPQNKRRIAIIMSGTIPNGTSLQYQKTTTMGQIKKLISPSKEE